MKKRTLLFLILLLPCFIQAADDSMRFRVYLKDKPAAITLKEKELLFSDHVGSVMRNPMPDLSPTSFERRQAQGIALDSSDYPVSEKYLKIIRDHGFHVVTQSRWMNTVVVSASDSLSMKNLLVLPFVKSIQLVWVNPSRKSAISDKMAIRKVKTVVDPTNLYGKADAQINMLDLAALHHDGHKGGNKLIAIVDAGFYGADTMFWFKNRSFVAARDFIYPPTSIYDGHAHGTAVLSTLAANEKFTFVGAAPEARYCLLRSEDAHSEFPIEEDYWIAAVEFADSIGVDIITCSLGYSEFDMPELSYKKNQLDGKTAFITRAASIAATKGMLLVCSAGNDGGDSWQKIGFPADAENVLVVGAVQSDLGKCYFSSTGPTADGRIKPDVMALGANICIVNGNGTLSACSGTSFSTPLVAGMAACLWGAYPSLKATELKQYIKQSGDRASKPDTLYGYGIPSARKIMFNLGQSALKEKKNNYYCYPNPAKDKLYFSGFSTYDEAVDVTISNFFGLRMMKAKLSGEHSYMDISHLADSIYLVDFLVLGEIKMRQKILIHK